MHPNPEKPYIVECDSSNYAIGAILSQKDENNKLHPVAYYSRSLNNSEINYSITDKELLKALKEEHEFLYSFEIEEAEKNRKKNNRNKILKLKSKKNQ